LCLPSSASFAKVEQRSKLALQDGAFLAAYLLDHRYQGANLSADQVLKATAFIQDYNVEEGAVTRWLAKAAPFTNWNEATVDPETWWSAGLKVGFPPKLCDPALISVNIAESRLVPDLALRLHATNATSAALERQLSTMRITSGMLRTRLGVERARKLSFCSRRLNEGEDLGEEDWE
jgi:hypothetical protein